VRLFGQVGQDSFGDQILRQLRRSGVGVQGVNRSLKTTTATTIALVHRSGERTFLHHGGASFALRPSDLDIERLLRARHLHYGGYYYLPRLKGQPARRLLKEAKRRGLTTSLDTGWDPSGRWIAALDDCLAYVDLLMPNEDEAAQLARRGDPLANGNYLLTLGPRMVVIKLGVAGCLVVTPKGHRHVRAYHVGAHDATGAGDVFNAGFVYGRVHGWSVQRSARLANAYGATRVALRDEGVRGAPELETFAEHTPLKPSNR
jgi:sugar/nucleoside kinase (ribokinase family)